MNDYEKKLLEISDLKECEDRRIGSAPPGDCDFCSTDLQQEMFFVDGKIKDEFASQPGAWGNMCPKCYHEKGAGIGYGVGQLYMMQKSGYWMTTAGFPPK